MKDKNKIYTLLALGLAIFVVILDGTLMNIAIKAIIQDLNTSAEAVQAMITIYALIMAMFTLIGARLGDIYGRKNIFLIGSGLFGIGALIATFAPNATVLLLGWSVIEGLGAALMMPSTLSLMASDFKGTDRSIGLGIWGGISALGAAFGPILGGFLTTHFTWRLAFFVEIIPILLIFLWAKVIPDKKDYIQKKQLDYKGSMLSATALGFLIYALLYANDFGWLFPNSTHSAGFLGLSITFWFILISFILFLFFIKQELKCEKHTNCLPLIDMNIFKNKTFTLSIIIALSISTAQAGALFILPLFLLIFRGFSAIDISITLLPLMLAIFLVSTFASRFDKHKRTITIAGLIITIISSFMLKTTITATTNLTDFIPGLVMLGIGIGLIMAQLTNITISSVKTVKAGEASGINSTIRRLGASLGTAIIGTILFSMLNTTNLPTAQSQISDISFINATRKSLDATIIILGIGLIASLFIPNKENPNCS